DRQRARQGCDLHGAAAARGEKIIAVTADNSLALKSLRYSGWVRFRKTAGHLIGILLAPTTCSLTLKWLRFSDWVCFANSRDPPSSSNRAGARRQLEPRRSRALILP